GVAVFLVGLGLFFHERIEELISRMSEYKTGVLLIAAAALAWAFYSLAQKQLLKTYGSASIMLWIFFVGSVVLLPFVEPGEVADLTGTQLALLAFCALNTLAAYACFAESLNHWDASRVSATLTIVPVITLGLMIFVDRFAPGYLPPEHLDCLNYLGAFLVVAGSMTASLAYGKSTKPDQPD
ncbi:MAG: EamA family transporter, partial [Planctomycetota bacterium]